MARMNMCDPAHPGELLTGWLDDLGGIVFDAKAAPGALRAVA